MAGFAGSMASMSPSGVTSHSTGAVISAPSGLSRRAEKVTSTSSAGRGTITSCGVIACTVKLASWVEPWLTQSTAMR